MDLVEETVAYETRNALMGRFAPMESVQILATNAASVPNASASGKKLYACVHQELLEIRPNCALQVSIRIGDCDKLYYLEICILPY